MKQRKNYPSDISLERFAQISTVPIAADMDEISRFQNARPLMGYSGMVPSENSSGG
jgi:hypothetical protein